MGETVEVQIRLLSDQTSPRSLATVVATVTANQALLPTNQIAMEWPKAEAAKRG